MDLKQVALNFITSPVLLSFAGLALGIIVHRLIVEKYNKPIVKEIALELAKAFEKETKEGTPEDKFLDSFISKFEEKMGREPKAGELKTALDIKKQEFSVGYSKDF